METITVEEAVEAEMAAILAAELNRDYACHFLFALGSAETKRVGCIMERYAAVHNLLDRYVDCARVDYAWLDGAAEHLGTSNWAVEQVADANDLGHGDLAKLRLSKLIKRRIERERRTLHGDDDA